MVKKKELTLKDILDNELMKEIVSVRIDSLWSIFSLMKIGKMPNVNSEKATGDLDDLGALFVPGGIVSEDSDQRSINEKHYERLGFLDFRKKVRYCMQYDNAILIYPDAMYYGVNLDNSFFIGLATKIVAERKAYFKKKFSVKPPLQIYSDTIAKSYCPKYVPSPYGSKTKLSSCLAVCLTEPDPFYEKTHRTLRLNERQLIRYRTNIADSLKPVVNKDGVVLAPPYVVVCHVSRYKEDIWTGITRILGLGKYGEFANFTMERPSAELLNELGPEKKEFIQEDFIAEFNGFGAVAVLRIFPPTNPGARELKGRKTYLVHPKTDLGLDLEMITKEARERYNL